MTSWIFSDPRVPGSYKHQNFKKALLVMDDDPHWLGLLIVPSPCSFKSSGSHGEHGDVCGRWTLGTHALSPFGTHKALLSEILHCLPKRCYQEVGHGPYSQWELAQSV